MVQFFPFLCCDLSVFAFSDPVQSQIHDPDPFQLLYLISQIPAHSADLPVQSLCQNDPKAAFSCLHHSAWSGHCIKNRDSLAHPSDKFPVHRLIHCHKRTISSQSRFTSTSRSVKSNVPADTAGNSRTTGRKTSHTTLCVQ